MGFLAEAQAQQIIPPNIQYVYSVVENQKSKAKFDFCNSTKESISFNFIDPNSCKNNTKGIETTVDFFINGKQVMYEDQTFVALRGLTRIWVWSDKDMLILCGAPWLYDGNPFKRTPNLNQIGLLIRFDFERNAFVATNIGRGGPVEKIYLS